MPLRPPVHVFTPARLAAVLLCVLLGWADVSRAQIAVVGELAHSNEAAPGSSYEGVIRVRNQTSAFQEVRVYQSDYLFFADGTNLFEEAGSLDRSNATWIDVQAEALTVPPSQTVPVTYTVTVPTIAPLTGTYWSLLVIEGVSAAPAASGDQELTVRTTTRYAVQIATSIAGSGEQSVAFSNPNLFVTDEGDNVLQVDLVNDGTLLVRPEVWVELYDAAGEPAGRYDGGRRRLYPGTSVRQQFDLGRPGAGRYNALVFVDAGDEDVFGAQYTLEF